MFTQKSRRHGIFLIFLFCRLFPYLERNFRILKCFSLKITRNHTGFFEFIGHGIIGIRRNKACICVIEGEENHTRWAGCLLLSKESRIMRLFFVRNVYSYINGPVSAVQFCRHGFLLCLCEPFAFCNLKVSHTLLSRNIAQGCMLKTPELIAEFFRG